MQYRVLKEFISYDQVVVEANSPEEAYEIAEANWYDLNPEGAGDYEPTKKFIVYDEKDSLAYWG